MSLIILAIILVVTRIKHDHFSFSSTLLKMLVFITAIGIVLEPVTWLVDKKEGAFAFNLGFIANSLILLFGTALSALWISYWDYNFLASKKRIIQRKYYLLPVIVQWLLLIYNRFTGVFFTIEKGTNTYVQTPLYYILYFIYLLYFVYLIILNIKYRKQIENKTILASIIFMTFPLFSIITQLIIPELLITWPSLTISLLLVYLFLETTTGNIDELTKLYTRRLLEFHLKSLIEDKKQFCAIMIDLDRFKDVNDLFGHSEGDKVLIEFASVLKKCLNQNDSFVARLGGDEFFIIIRNTNEDEPMKLIDQVKNMMTQNTFLTKFPFLDFSAGYISYKEELSVDDILNISDRKMYEQKRNKRLEYENQIIKNNK